MRSVSLLASVCLLLLSLPCISVYGWAPYPAGSYNGTLPAFVQLQFVEIAKIDGVEQAFSADFYMLTTWPAPMANASSFDYAAAVDNTLYWNPQLEFINGREEVRRLVAESDSVYFSDKPLFDPSVWGFTLPTGWVWLMDDQRYQSSFTTPLELERFPYDEQDMILNIESFFDTTQVKIYWADPKTITKVIPAIMPDVVGWTTNPQKSYYSNKDVVYDYNQRVYNRLVVATRLTRDPTFYLTKIVAGTMLLVYMCIWVFALAVDEADRMMGTLQVFAGLITFLFVASQDTPKVPYQTRLDLFLMFCFFIVGLIMFIHSTLYYWREADLEEEEEEKKEEKEIDDYNKRAIQHNKELFEKREHDAIELGQVNASGAISPSGNTRPPLPEPKEGTGEDDVWKIRTKERPPFTFRRWFRGLLFTRKFDAFFVPFLMIGFSIGVAVILGTAKKAKTSNAS